MKSTNHTDRLLNLVLPFTFGCGFAAFSLVGMQVADNHSQVSKCESLKTRQIITQRSVVGTLKSCVSVSQLYLQ